MPSIDNHAFLSRINVLIGNSNTWFCLCFRNILGIGKKKFSGEWHLWNSIHIYFLNFDFEITLLSKVKGTIVIIGLFTCADNP